MTDTVDPPAQPPRHRPLRRRGDVPRPGPPVRGGARPAPGLQDGQGGADPAGHHRRVLRARDHGRRDPRPVRRRRRHLLHVHPGGGGAGPRGRLGGGAGRRAEHAGEQRAPALGQRRAEGAVLPEAGLRSGSAPTRSPRRDRAPTPSRWPAAPRTRATHFELTGRKLWITNAAEAELFIVLATVDPAEGLQGHHRVPGRARHPRVHASARRRTSSASAPPRPASSSSRAAASRGRTCWARWGRATRSPSRP